MNRNMELNGWKFDDVAQGMAWIKAYADKHCVDEAKIMPEFVAQGGVSVDDNGVATVRIQGVMHPYWGFYAGDIVEELDKADAKTINVLIDSVGGSIAEMRTLWGDFQRRRADGVKLTTEVVGTAYSAAAMTFLAGEDRIVRETVSSVMIHGAWTIALLIGNLGDLRRQWNDLEAGMQHHEHLFVEMIKASTGVAAEKAEDWLSKDTYFTCEECVSEGIATEMIPIAKNKDDDADASETQWTNAAKIIVANALSKRLKHV